MGTIVDIEKVTACLGTFSFREFCNVQEFRFYQDYEDVQDYGVAKVDMIVETEDRPENYRLHLRFTRVSGLKLKEFGSTLTTITGFAIDDISDRHWEDVNWRIYDYENNMIEFLCKLVEVVSMERV